MRSIVKTTKRSDSRIDPLNRASRTTRSNTDFQKAMRNIAVGLAVFVVLFCTSAVHASRNPPPPSNERRITLASGLTNAENSLMTSDGKLFVSSEDGIHEIKKSVYGGYYKVDRLAGDATCGGMVQSNSMLYAVCKLNGKKSLVARSLYGSASFGKIYTLDRMFGRIVNGLVADSQGRLYMCTTGRKIFQFKMKTAYSVDKQVDWLDVGGDRTNGITIHGSYVYFTTNGTILPGTGTARLNRVLIKSNGTAGSRNVLHSNTFDFYDDMAYENYGRLIVAHYTDDRIIKFNTAGGSLPAKSSRVFDKPSSVIPVTGSMFASQGAGPWYIVTERGSDRVSLYRFP